MSTKKLISNYNFNNKNSKLKIATCGVPEGAQEDYLNKIKDLKFKIVNKNEDYDYIIMNNRITWELGNDLSNPKKIRTCFEKYNGIDVAEIKRRGLTLSKITKKN